MFPVCSAKRLKDRRKVEKFDEKEESVDKDTPIKIMDKTRVEADKMDSNKLLSPELAKSGEIQNGSSRSGASSPSPSDGVCGERERERERKRERRGKRHRERGIHTHSIISILVCVY